MTSKRSDAAQVVAWVAVVVILVGGVVGAVNRGVKERPDWGDLSYDSRYVWEHGHTAPGTTMFGYLPTTSFALWPFSAWLPVPVGVLVFIATNIAAAAGSIWLGWRWWNGTPTGQSWFVWPVLLVAVNLAHALHANQLTLWTLLLCMAGLLLVGPTATRSSDRWRMLGGGVLLGLAALIKVMPGLLGVYLLLRRRWWALGGMCAAMIVFDLAPCVAFFGWRDTIDEHRAWLRRAGWHGNHHLIEQPLLRVHRHGTNSSLAAVLTRWLRALPDAQRQVILYGEPPAEVVEQYRAALAPGEVLTLDPMPPRTGEWSEKRVDISWVPRFRVADLPASVVWWLWFTPLATAFVMLLWFTWWTGGRGESEDWALVSALWMLAMFWPSPMTRHYYLAWAFPALLVVCRAWWVSAQVVPRHSLARWVYAAACIAWIIGLACLGSKVIRWYGVHLGVLAVLAFAVAVAWYELRSRYRTLASTV